MTMFRFTHEGETRSLSSWAARLGRSPGLVYGRVKRGWTPAQALDLEPPPNRPPSHARLITINGETMCVLDWVRRTRKHQSTVMARLANGWTPEQALGFAPRPTWAKNSGRKEGQESKRITYKGETRTLLKWAAKLGVPHRTLHGRLRRGWSDAQILGFEPPPSNRRNGRMLSFNGETHSVSRWAKLRGLEPPRLFKRLALDWPLAQALGFEPRVRGERRALAEATPDEAVGVDPAAADRNAA